MQDKKQKGRGGQMMKNNPQLIRHMDLILFFLLCMHSQLMSFYMLTMQTSTQFGNKTQWLELPNFIKYFYMHFIFFYMHYCIEIHSLCSVILLCRKIFVLNTNCFFFSSEAHYSLCTR